MSGDDADDRAGASASAAAGPTGAAAIVGAGVVAPRAATGTLRLLLVDDEPLARQWLRSLVERLGDDPSAVVVGEAGDADAALRWLDRHHADAVLLDIRLPGLAADGGLRLAERLRRLPRAPAVVFVTAHAEHALVAFELAATDYLTKPVRLARLQAALRRVRPRTDEQEEVTAAVASAPAPASASAVEADTDGEADGVAPALVIAERGRVLRLPLSELRLLRAEHKQVVIRTDMHVYRVDDTLGELERRLTGLGGRFIRVHRNALVALAAVRAVELRQSLAQTPLSPTEGPSQPELEEGWAVRVAPWDEWVPVSRRQVAALKTALLGPRTA